MVDFVVRSWADMRRLSEIVAEKIIDSGFKPDYIVAIVRGGMVPAMNLSDVLGVHDVLTVRVKRWSKTAVKDKGGPVLVNTLNASIRGGKVLLVDDLTDTGDSIRLAKEYLMSLGPKEVRTATLIHKTTSTFEPDYYAEKEEHSLWVVFPWNVYEDTQSIHISM